MITRMQQRRGTSLEWQAVADTVILASGEIGLETDTGHYKVGDGITVWTNLPYFTSDRYNSDVYAKLNADQDFFGIQTFIQPDSTKTPVIARGLENQTADLQQWDIESTLVIDEDEGISEKVITTVASVAADGVITANGVNVGDISIEIDNVTDPLNPVARIRNIPNSPEFQDEAVNKAYVDTAQSGLATKPPVKAATTGGITLSGTQTIDDIPMVIGDRVLVKNQTNLKENGIYVVASSSWTRASDTNSETNTKRGTYVLVENGTANENTSWVLTTEGTGVDNGIVFGTDDIKFELFFNPGELSAGNGLTKTGVTFSVVGTANEIDVSPSGVSISDTYPGQTSITTVGTITEGTWNGGVIPVANGGTGKSSLLGFVYGNGSEYTASPQIDAAAVSGDISGRSSNITGTAAIENGGTGANTASQARTNLGAAAAVHTHSAAEITSGRLGSVYGGVPTGAIMQWFTNTPPEGWVFCHGQVTDPYPALAAVIGARIPNLQTRVPVGRNTSGGTFSTLGAVGGSESHAHGRGNYSAAIGAVNGNVYTIGYEPGAPRPDNQGPGTAFYGIRGADFVGQGSFNHYTPVYGTSSQASSLQPYIVLNYIIKT